MNADGEHSKQTAAEMQLAAIAAIEDAVLRVQAHEHEHGLATNRTRQLPRGVIRQLRHWKRLTAKHAATFTDVAADSHRASGQREADQSSSSVRKEPRNANHV